MRNVGRGRCGKTQERRATKLLFFLQPLVLPNFFSPLHPLFFPTPSRRARHLSSSNPHHPTHRHLRIATTPFHHLTFYSQATRSTLGLSQPCLSQANGSQSSSVSRQVRYVCSPGIQTSFPAPLSSQKTSRSFNRQCQYQRTAINQFTSETPKQPTSDRREQCEFDCAFSCLLPVIKIISRATPSNSGGLRIGALRQVVWPR